jgi:ATP synthase protein I
MIFPQKQELMQSAGRLTPWGTQIKVATNFGSANQPAVFELKRMAHEKLKDLERRLEQTRPTQKGGDSSRREEGSALGLATRAITELVVGIAVAMGLGWMLDRWLGTRPWLMLVLLPFGFAAGVVNVMRLSRSKQADELMGGGAASQTPAKPVTDDDED